MLFTEEDLERLTNFEVNGDEEFETQSDNESDDEHLDSNADHTLLNTSTQQEEQTIPLAQAPTFAPGSDTPSALPATCARYVVPFSSPAYARVRPHLGTTKDSSTLTMDPGMWFTVLHSFQLIDVHRYTIRTQTTYAFHI